MSSFGQEETATAVRQGLEELGFEPPSSIVLNKIPFSGNWGWATPACFQLASAEKKAGRDIVPAQRAQEIAESLREKLVASGDFFQVEASRGYVNIFFETGEVAGKLLDAVFTQGADYGRSPDRGERVMIEFSQPNTHKAFHVGHLRNVCLGQSLAQILDFAGFEVLRANYPGDIGLHVIKCLWCYQRFHKGEQPPANKGRWLGEMYAEADGLLSRADEYRDNVIEFIRGATRPETAGGLIWKSLAAIFLSRIESALGAAESDSEVKQDLVTLLHQFWMEEPFEFNEIAYRTIADVVWDIWVDLGLELEDAAANAHGDEKEADIVRKLSAKHSEIGLHPERWGYARELRHLFHRWEAEDPELQALWEETRQWSLDDFKRIYAQLGTDFDVWFYEHEEEKGGKEIVRELVDRGLATDLRPTGPVLLKLDEILKNEKPDYRTIVILRADGTSLYSTKDLSLAKRKFEEFKADRSIYVVDVGQALYFKQIFKVLELWGFEQASKCFHLSYEIVRLPSGKMSSREGSVVFYDDFYRDALSKAREAVDDKRSEEQFADLPDLDTAQRDKVAAAVALGAMKYGMLSVDNNKQINFDFERSLSFQGQTAPYIQYSHARACRILEKAGGERPDASVYRNIDVETAEINLMEQIAAFSTEVERSAREYKPHFIAVYLYKLAKSFNEFYRDCPVLRADEEIREARLALVAATHQTLANGLRLLGIPAPDVM